MFFAEPQDSMTAATAQRPKSRLSMSFPYSGSVSYTHLAVYKRQYSSSALKLPSASSIDLI